MGESGNPRSRRNCYGGCPEMGVKVPCPGVWWSRSRASSGPVGKWDGA